MKSVLVSLMGTGFIKLEVHALFAGLEDAGELLPGVYRQHTNNSIKNLLVR